MLAAKYNKGEKVVATSPHGLTLLVTVDSVYGEGVDNEIYYRLVTDGGNEAVIPESAIVRVH